MSRSNRAVAMVLGALASAGCTQPNPAFGDERDDASKTETGNDASTTNNVDPTSTTVSTSATTAMTEPDSADSSSGGRDTTTGGEACRLPEPHFFDVVATTLEGDVMPPECGGLQVFEGAVMPGEFGNQLQMSVCLGGGCVCDAVPMIVQLTFNDLAPSPVDAIDSGNNGCIAITVARRSEQDGCGVEWLSTETLVIPAVYPSFLATNAPNPGWGYGVPTTKLGERLEVCDALECQSRLRPGLYTLSIGQYGPLAPGESTPAELNPYGNTPTSYELTALFAQVDEACMLFGGWVALHVDNG